MSKIIILCLVVIILGFPPLYSHFTQATLSKEERLAQFAPAGIIADYFAPTGEAIVHNELRHFRKLNHKIYYFFPIPLAQYGVPLQDADAKSFKTLAQHFGWQNSYEQDHLRRKNIALDQNHVYCGFQKIPNLNPSSLIYLGDGYLSDGHSTYYCDWEYQARSDSVPPTQHEKLSAMLFGKKIAKSGYYYPLYALKNGKHPYRLILENIVTNGESSYVEGKELQSTALSQLRYLSTFQPDENIWQVNSYLTDQKHVFYKNEILDLKFHPDLESIPFNFKVYLYDPLNDRYFYQSHKIDHPNLKMIQKDDQHSFVPIFTSDARVAYFNTQKMQLELLNKNPFMKELHRLSPSVFSNGQDIYYFRKYKTFSSTLFMDFSELCSTTSEIRVLKNVPIDGWHKAEELWIPHHEYPGTQFKGRFWTYADRLFYLPEDGSWTDSLFEVLPNPNIDQLRKNQLNYTQAEELFKNTEIFKPVKGKSFSKIKEIQRFCFKNIFS